MIVDDARVFIAPPTIMRRSDWPSLTHVFDRARAADRDVTLAHDVFIIALKEAREIADWFAASDPWRKSPLAKRALRHFLARALASLEDS